MSSNTNTDESNQVGAVERRRKWMHRYDSIGAKAASLIVNARRRRGGGAVGQKATGTDDDQDEDPDRLPRLVESLAEELNIDFEKLLEAFAEFADGDEAATLEREQRLLNDPGQGQKTNTGADEEMTAGLVRRIEERIAERKDEAMRDDHGNFTGAAHERQEDDVDDLGQRKQRPKMTPRERHKKLEEILDDVDTPKPRSGRPVHAPTDDETGGDVDPRISEAVDREGW